MIKVFAIKCAKRKEINRFCRSYLYRLSCTTTLTVGNRKFKILAVVEGRRDVSRRRAHGSCRGGGGAVLKHKTFVFYIIYIYIHVRVCVSEKKVSEKTKTTTGDDYGGGGGVDRHRPLKPRCLATYLTHPRPSCAATV